MEYDPVKAPSHYHGSGMQAKDVISAYYLGYHLGCVMKYILRHQNKQDPKQDILKAVEYLEMFIERHLKIQARNLWAVEAQLAAWEAASRHGYTYAGVTRPDIMKAFNLPSPLAVVIDGIISLRRIPSKLISAHVEIIIEDLKSYGETL
jgi:hypothetical protein